MARCARIYSVALPVLLAVVRARGLCGGIAGVAVTSGYQVVKPYIYIPFHLVFMGEFWNLSETPPWLIPYWSLGYEVWYYVLFGAAYYLPAPSASLLVGACCCWSGSSCGCCCRSG